MRSLARLADRFIAANSRPGQNLWQFLRIYAVGMQHAGF